MSAYLADTAEDLIVEGPSARFTYRRMGPRGGVPLVLLHRFRGTIDWWDPGFLDYLASGHDVIVFDNVGIGYTTGEPRDSVEGFGDAGGQVVADRGQVVADLGDAGALDGVEPVHGASQAGLTEMILSWDASLPGSLA